MITSHEDWLKEYRKDRYKTWIKVTLSDDSVRYFCDYDDWQKIKILCCQNSLDVIELGLQRKSNYVGVDTSDCDGVYLIRSMIGMMGADSIKTYTVGKICGDIVKKQIFLIPELIEHRKEEDAISSCFQQALIYHNGKSKT